VSGSARGTRPRTPEPCAGGCGRTLYLSAQERAQPKRWYCTGICAERHHREEVAARHRARVQAERDRYYRRRNGTSEE